MKRFIVLGGLVAVIVGGLLFGWPSDKPASTKVRPGLVTQYGFSKDPRFATIDPTEPYSFPNDHGVHQDSRTESWHFSGSMFSQQGRPYAYQLSFFRVALANGSEKRASAWAADQILRAHFAVTDVSEERFYSFERYGRAALGMSGAESPPLRVWVDNWRLQQPGANGQTQTFRLQAADGPVAIDLELSGRRPALLPGEFGLFGGASSRFRYFRLSRLTTTGFIRIGRQRWSVNGQSSLDRAWGAVPLPIPTGQVAWNRFSLMLDNGRELIVFQLRRRDGSAAPLNSGLWVSEKQMSRLGRNDLHFEERAYWSSPADGVRYPVRWRVRVPGHRIDWVVAAAIHNQEVKHTWGYGGGAVEVTNATTGKRLGHGYVELTGYAPSH